jgi:phospholipid/cholesterol/gamma-HCH transport system ATP-binding protein
MTASESACVIDLVDATVGASGAADSPSIQGIDWRVRGGDYWVVAALSNSGKTELLTTLAGLQPPLTGRCIVLGQDLRRLEEPGLVELRRQIGLVFADGGRLFSGLTLAENVALPLAYHSGGSMTDTAADVEELLALTELGPFAGRLPGQVGRAWRQRAALARSLALKPQLLLLDNPIAGFDARHVRWWLSLLSRLNAGHPFLDGQRLTIVVAADHLRPWSDHARQFAVIRDRRFTTFESRARLAASDDALVREWLDGVVAASSA